MNGEIVTAARCLNAVIDYMPDAIFAINLDGIVIAWNKKMEELTGSKAKDVLGHNGGSYSTPIYGYKRKILIDMVFEPDSELEKEYEDFQRLDNNVVMGRIYIPHIQKTLWGKATPITDGRGNIIGAIESIRDVTEFIEAQKGLKENEEKFRSLYDVTQLFLDSIKEMVWAKDVDNRFIFANKTFQKVIKRDAKELIGRKSFDLFISDTTDETDNMAKFKPCHFVENIIIDDNEIWLDVCKAPLINDKGILLGTIGTARNITEEVNERKKEDVKIEQLKQQIESEIGKWKVEREKTYKDVTDRISASMEIIKKVQKAHNISDMEIYY